MLSVFHILSNDTLSKLPIRKQIIQLKKKEKVKTYVWFLFDLKGFCTFSAPVLVKKHHSEMGTQYLFSFIIITGIILQSTQGNVCKQTSEPCVYNLLELREKEGNYFLIIPYTSSIGTRLGRHTDQGAHRATHSRTPHETLSEFSSSTGPECTPRGY